MTLPTYAHPNQAGGINKVTPGINSPEQISTHVITHRQPTGCARDARRVLIEKKAKTALILFVSATEVCDI